jgi:hypothetical protein
MTVPAVNDAFDPAVPGRFLDPSSDVFRVPVDDEIGTRVPRNFRLRVSANSSRYPSASPLC